MVADHLFYEIIARRKGENINCKTHCSIRSNTYIIHTFTKIDWLKIIFLTVINPIVSFSRLLK